MIDTINRFVQNNSISGFLLTVRRCVMHIACVKNHGIPYLQVMEYYSVRDKGSRVYKKRSILNLGPLARFSDGDPDYLRKLRESFKEGNPIIPELRSLC